MTPQAEADRLIEVFEPYADSPFQSIKERNAKACAIKCVEELLKELSNLDSVAAYNRWKYWQSVKDALINK